MPVFHGIAGSIDWTGYENLVGDTGSDSEPREYTLNINDQMVDSTAFVDTTSMTHVAGLRDWSGSFTTRLNPATIGGVTGTFALTLGYAANCRGWTLNIKTQEFESTAFTPTALWKTFIPGLVSWDASMEHYLDDITVLVAAGTSVTPTFTLITSNTYTGSGIVGPSQAVSVPATGIATVTQTVTGTGAITAAGTANFFTAGAIGLQTAGALTLTATGSRQYVGLAFWTGVTIRCAVDGLIEADVAFRGTGALGLV